MKTTVKELKLLLRTMREADDSVSHAKDLIYPEFFADVRHHLGLTQAVLALKLACSHEYISRVECGRSPMTISLAAKLAELVGV